MNISSWHATWCLQAFNIIQWNQRGIVNCYEFLPTTLNLSWKCQLVSGIFMVFLICIFCIYFVKIIKAFQPQVASWLRFYCSLEHYWFLSQHKRIRIWRNLSLSNFLWCKISLRERFVLSEDKLWTCSFSNGCQNQYQYL